ncbi:MAG: ACT domain-containing protein [Spirochaetes bacterium]|nr:ACT domain-containing protein [Spirochaetota bacterium]
MLIKQISIFLENKKGRLAEVTQVLADEKVNIRALSLADSRDFGVLRIIVDDPNRCLDILKAKRFIAQTTEVVGIEIEDKPGGLYKVLDIIEANDINIEYMYATVDRSKDNAIVIFRVDDTKKTVEILHKNGINL